MTFPSNTTVIVAGSTGLIGSSLIKQLLLEPNISNVTALSRRPLPFQADKLQVALHTPLAVPIVASTETSYHYGFICLGTTIKQAGSKDALEAIDRHLVVNIAEQMKTAGVRHLAVVSSIGANAKSASHYLRCKGLMEQEVEALGFDSLVFVQPGPLSGERETTRKDEVWLQRVSKWIEPLMIAGLKKYVPISGEDVATAMMSAVTQPNTKSVQRLNTIELRDLIP